MKKFVNKGQFPRPLTEEQQQERQAGIKRGWTKRRGFAIPDEMMDGYLKLRKNCGAHEAARTLGLVKGLKTVSVREFHEKGWPKKAFVFKFRSFDIPTTISRMIAALPANCVAIGLNLRGGPQMVRAAERAARKKGIRILWRFFPSR